MKTRLLLLAFALLALTRAFAQDSYKFYVAPTGSDAAKGTRLEAPFATLDSPQGTRLPLACSTRVRNSTW